MFPRWRPPVWLRSVPLLNTLPLLRSVALLLVGMLLMRISVEIVRHDFEAFVNHGPLHDREPAWGELTLYCSHLVLGVPAAWCFGLGLVGLGKRWNLPATGSFSPRAHLWAAACFAAFAAWTIGFAVTDFAWFTDDEQAYLYQAKLYGRGMLSGPVMEPVELLRHPFVVLVAPDDGVPQWTGVYPVLQPFLMAISAKLGFVHWSQLVCVAVVVFQTGRLAQVLFGDERLGVVASWLGAFSPMLLGLGATHHTSVLATALSVCAVRSLIGVMARWTPLAALGLGLLTGTIFLARPMEGTLCSLSFAGVLLVRWRQVVRNGEPAIGSLLPLLGYAAGGAVPLAVFLSVNMAHTGQPLLSAYKILEQQIGGFFGFGDGKMWGRTHTPELAARQTLGALVRMNAWLFGWPASLALWFLSLLRPFRGTKVVLLLSLSVVQLCAYAPLAFGSVHDFGSAYHVWHLPWIACITAHVLGRLQRVSFGAAWLRRLPPFATAAGMTLAGVCGFWPLQLQRWKAVSDVVLAPVRAAETATAGVRAIVLWSQYLPPIPLRSWVHYPPSPHPGDRVIWARYSPQLLAQLRARHPDRQFFGLAWEGTTPVVVSMQATVETLSRMLPAPSVPAPSVPAPSVPAPSAPAPTSPPTTAMTPP